MRGGDFTDFKRCPKAPILRVADHPLPIAVPIQPAGNSGVQSLGARAIHRSISSCAGRGASEGLSVMRDRRTHRQ
jgi:hypothetical protein